MRTSNGFTPRRSTSPLRQSRSAAIGALFQCLLSSLSASRSSGAPASTKQPNKRHATLKARRCRRTGGPTGGQAIIAGSTPSGESYVLFRLKSSRLCLRFRLHHILIMTTMYYGIQVDACFRRRSSFSITGAVTMRARIRCPFPHQLRTSHHLPYSSLYDLSSRICLHSASSGSPAFPLVSRHRVSLVPGLFPPASVSRSSGAT